MKKRVPVSEIMTKNVLTVSISDSLRHANALMKEKNIRHIPVVNGNKLVGILSKTDIMRLSFGDLYESQAGTDEAMFDMLNIGQVMVHDPVTADKEETVKEVAEKLAAAEYHALPVTEDGNIIGIVTTTDIIRYLLEQYN